MYRFWRAGIYNCPKTQYLDCAKETYSSFTPPGPTLEEKLFSSCDLTADKSAQISFKSKQSLAQMAPKAKVSSQFSTSPKARNWAAAPKDLNSVFISEKLQETSATAPNLPPSAAGASPQSSSDSGERSACLLDLVAASSLLALLQHYT